MIVSIFNILLLINLFGTEYPLGCIENETPIHLNMPFYTIPLGAKALYEEVCNLKDRAYDNISDKAKPLNDKMKIKKDKTGITIEKRSTPIRKFYPSENLEIYAGITFGKMFIKKENTIFLYMQKESQDGLFLLVLKEGDLIYARQIIIDDIKCPVKVTAKIEEFYQIPYKKNDIKDGEYEVNLYVINYNSLRWKILGLEIR